MTHTTKAALAAAALGTAFAANMAMADAVAFSAIDADASGTLEMAELEAAFGAKANAALAMYDTNGDGVIGEDEATEISLNASGNADAGLDKARDNAAEQAQDALDRADDAAVNGGANAEAGAEANDDTGVDAEAGADVEAGVSVSQ